MSKDEKLKDDVVPNTQSGESGNDLDNTIIEVNQMHTSSVEAGNEAEALLDVNDHEVADIQPYTMQTTAEEDPEEEERTRITQIRAMYSEADQTNLPDFPTRITQIQAMHAEADSTPLPVFATHISQIRNSVLLGSLTDAPGDRNFLTQLRAMGVDRTPLDTQPLLYNIHKQVLQETEPAEWMRFFNVANQVVRREFTLGQTNVHVAMNQVTIQLEAPREAPKRHVGVSTQYAMDAQYTAANLVRSATKLLASDFVVSLKDSSYKAADSIQSPTLNRSLNQQAATKWNMRDPDTMLAGIVQHTTQVHYGEVDVLNPAEDLRSETHSTTITSTVAELADGINPLDVRSESHNAVITSTVAELADGINPLDVRSSSHAISQTATMSEAVTETNPLDVRSYSQQIGTSLLRSALMSMVDPGALRSSVHGRATGNSFAAAVSNYLDPTTLTSSILGRLINQQTSIMVEYRDPIDLRATNQMRGLNQMVAAQSDMADPDTLQSKVESRSQEQKVAIKHEMLNPLDVLSSIRNRVVHHLSSESRVMRDPTMIGVTTNNLATDSSFSHSVELVDPKGMQSQTKQSALFALASEVFDMINPNWLYEYPSRHLSTVSMVSSPIEYENPIGPVSYWHPMVSANYIFRR